MRYEGSIYRPPSEANSLILQATIGCSWNACTYCDMYRDKTFRVRDLGSTLEDIALARAAYGPRIEKVFVADGDALILEMEAWTSILEACREAFPNLRRVSAYATAMNLLEKSPEELEELKRQGLSLLYIGPESGDDTVLKRIAKGANFEDHVVAAEKAHSAGMKLSAIFLLGVGGTDRSSEHAAASARLASEMNPRFLSVLTLTVLPQTPLGTQEDRGQFELPEVDVLLRELRTFVDEVRPVDSIFRTNHASNYLPLGGRLPRDREKIVGVLDAALSGEIPLRDEWARGL